MYSIEEVLNFTVKDIQRPNFSVVQVRGWLELTSEQRKQCIMKLRFTSAQVGLANSTRNLQRQRDEMAQSTTVDAKDLEDRLNCIERSRSPTPFAPYDPNDPKHVDDVLKTESEAHKELVGDNSRACYPIELGLDVFNNAGQYKHIISYWQAEAGGNQWQNRLVFLMQLNRWKRFRQFQQKNRSYFVLHQRFPEFQQKVLERRRRHGLDGDPRLREEQGKQSEIDDWMEYQDYELRTYERLEKELEEDQALLVSRRKALAEAGVSAFEGIQELEFASFYSLSIQQSGEEGKAKKRERLAKQQLKLAEERLNAAESDDVGEIVEKATWVGLFLKEVESAQMRLGELQRLADDAKSDLEPFNRWLQARHNEWDDESEEGKRLIRIEVESADYQHRMKRLDELGKKNHEAEMKHFLAEEEVEFAEEGYKAAQLDNFGESVERAALIKQTQEEVRSAKTQFEQANESTEKIKLKGKVISALSSIPLTRRKMKQHNVLLEWIEQQRREIARTCADTEKEGDQGQSKGASSRVLRNHLFKPSEANGRKTKQSTTKSILSPTDPAKVSKASSKRRSPRQKIQVPYNASQPGKKTTTNSSTPESRSKQAFKVKDAMPSALRPTHPSRVSKPGKKWPTELRRGGTKLPPMTDTSSTLPRAKKAHYHCAKVSLRRTTRISKPPERFRPGSA